GFLEPARRAGVPARCAIHLASNRRLFWQVRVAQGSMARCAVRSRPTGFLSGIGASRRVYGAARKRRISNLPA
ncbi:hypothetical protein A2U01_0090093, partial [Trifolium medium]|nr:hypothetical protein [Trifolium medium]